MVSLLFLVNITFLVINIVGGIFFTLGPTIKSSLKVIRMQLENEKVSFFKDYFKEFYTSYFPAIFTTIPHIIFLILGGFSFWLSFHNLSGSFIFYLTLVITLIFLVYILTSLIYVFFFKNRLDCTYFEAFKLSLTHPWGKFGYLMLILLSILLSFTLLVVFLFGAIFLAVEYFGSKAFTQQYFLRMQQKIDDKKREMSEIAEELKAEDLAKAKLIYDKKNSKNKKENSKRNEDK